MYTDCAGLEARYYIESLTVGEEAYRQADEIAVAINAYLDKGEDDENN